MKNLFDSFSLLVFLIIFLINKPGFSQSQIDSKKLDNLLKFSKENYADEILILHKDSVISHWENKGCKQKIFKTASMVKSWTGIIIGIMIDNNLIKDENELVCKYLPDWKDGCNKNITIKNLLTMSAGFKRRGGVSGILPVVDKNNYVLKSKLDYEPNIKFGYSNESVQLLGILIERVSGKSANTYFKDVLFKPLGMKHTKLTKDKSGNDMVFGGAETTASDASKIGILINSFGNYNGKKIVSPSWIEKSLKPSEKANYYGYLWWLDNNSTYKNIAAMGDFGQLTIVFPELDLIFIRRQTCNKDVSGNMKWMGPKFIKSISDIIIKE